MPAMPPRELPPMPGVDPANAPWPGEPGYEAWLLSTVYSPEGVDRAQIWEMLHLTPAERLERLQGFVDFALAARGRRPEIR